MQVERYRKFGQCGLKVFSRWLRGWPPRGDGGGGRGQPCLRRDEHYIGQWRQL